MFIYYFLNSDINPSVDAFYYQAIADSFHNGTGFVDITTIPPQPIITPQYGIVFIQVLLKYLGLHGAQQGLLAVKLIHYVGFLLLIYCFYHAFIQLNVSREIIWLSLGILLASAHFLKTIVQPLNEGMWCVLTAIVYSTALSNYSKESLVKMAIIAISGILLANFRMNGPLIILSIALAYLVLQYYKKSLLYLVIFVVSCGSVYVIISVLNVEYSGFKKFSEIYTLEYILYQPVVTAMATLPGVFLGLTGRETLFTIPISILAFIFYGIYLKKAYKVNNFADLIAIIYILLLIIMLQIMPGGNSRYIIMVMPFSLVAIATYFKDSFRLRVCLIIILIFTMLVSLYRIIFWDNIYFDNNKSLYSIRNEIKEPYLLISQSPRYSYYIFGKGSHHKEDVFKTQKDIVIFGKNDYVQNTIQEFQKVLMIDRIEHLNGKMITGQGADERYLTVRIIQK